MNYFHVWFVLIIFGSLVNNLFGVKIFNPFPSSDDMSDQSSSSAFCLLNDNWKKHWIFSDFTEHSMVFIMLWINVDILCLLPQNCIVYDYMER